MTRDSSTDEIDLAGRLRDLEHFTGTLVARRDAEPLAVPINEAPTTRVPMPRRSRIFLRSGERHGTFAELTLTAPRPALD